MIWGAVELAALLVYAACAATLVVRMVFVRLIWDRYHEEVEIVCGEIPRALRFVALADRDPTRDFRSRLYSLCAALAFRRAESCRLALWLNPALFSFFEQAQRFVGKEFEF